MQAIEKAYKDAGDMFPFETGLRVGAHIVENNGPEMCMFCIRGVTHHIMSAVIDQLK